MELADRYRGCLLGLACADALGGPVEFLSRAEIARLHPNGPREFTGGGWLHLAPGEITDDTQMTLALARSLADGGPLDMADIAARFVAWADSKPKDIGSTTRGALDLLAQGVPWDEAGERIQQAALPRGAAANGSVMRCAPIALRFRGDLPGLVQASIATSRVTHADPRCTWGTVAVNQAIAYLLDGGSIRDAIAAAVVDVPETRVVEAVYTASRRGRDEIRSGGFVLDTIVAAFWSLSSNDSFEETVVASVALGDDADTTGAVAGALAGAHYGASAIPTRWLELLQPRVELVALADRLFDLNEQEVKTIR
ncbi:MAG: ADP-ribosylglycohydrolase family protein [Thermomicrobiales bacterium]